MMKKLEGKTVLVTGGSTGIGKAIALRCAEEGADVAINYHSSRGKAEITELEVKKACEIIKSHGCRDLIIGADVADEADVKNMFAEIINRWGRLDILINNAGIQIPAPSHEVSMEDFDRVMGVNIRGVFLCAREAIRHFLSREGGGVIVNDSSVHAVIPKPGYVSYATSKAGMSNLTATLALEYADRGIRVNAVGPGAILTPINKAWKDDPAARAEVERHIPVGRAGEPEEIAAVFVFLASKEASYITGQTIYACGGLTLYPDFRIPWSSGGSQGGN